ncbi:hypothetical protein BJ508DRAFT_343147 [Ascobolus immersus RN42]|uniref:Uncharacterized protein n=1 Tax=Ascobolus immersus RN42 TaxID=1160509 RepID=A0A3N4IAL5_ASCIM|nr:hypothetical protein BJ508DRAFT_343147 [Ascobolus immersus RN42]
MVNSACSLPQSPRSQQDAPKPVKTHRKRRSTTSNTMAPFTPSKIPTRTLTMLTQPPSPTKSLGLALPKRSLTTPSPTKPPRRVGTTATAPPKMATLPTSSTTSLAKTPVKTSRTATRDSPVANAKAMLFAKAENQVESGPNKIQQPTMLLSEADEVGESDDAVGYKMSMGSTKMLSIPTRDEKGQMAASVSPERTLRYVSSFESPRKPKIPTRLLAKRFEEGNQQGGIVVNGSLTATEEVDSLVQGGEEHVHLGQTSNGSVAIEAADRKNRRRANSALTASSIMIKDIDIKEHDPDTSIRSQAKTAPPPFRRVIWHAASRSSLSSSISKKQPPARPRTTRTNANQCKRFKLHRDPSDDLKALALLLKGITYTGTTPITTAGKAPNWLHSLFKQKEVSEIPTNYSPNPIQCTVAGVDGYWRFPEFEYNAHALGSSPVRQTLLRVGSTLGITAIPEEGEFAAEEVEYEGPYSEHYLHGPDEDIDAYIPTIPLNLDGTDERNLEHELSSPPLRPLISRPSSASLAAISKVTATGTTTRPPPDFSLNPLTIIPAIDYPFSTTTTSSSRTSTPSSHRYKHPAFPSIIRLPHPSYSPPSSHPPIATPATPSTSTFSFFAPARSDPDSGMGTPMSKYIEVDVGDRYEWEPSLTAPEEGPTGYFVFKGFEKGKTYRQKRVKRGGNI